MTKRNYNLRTKVYSAFAGLAALAMTALNSHAGTNDANFATNKRAVAYAESGVYSDRFGASAGVGVRGKNLGANVFGDYSCGDVGASLGAEAFLGDLQVFGNLYGARGAKGGQAIGADTGVAYPLVKGEKGGVDIILGGYDFNMSDGRETKNYLGVMAGLEAALKLPLGIQVFASGSAVSEAGAFGGRDAIYKLGLRFPSQTTSVRRLSVGYLGIPEKYVEEKKDDGTTSGGVVTEKSERKEKREDKDQDDHDDQDDGDDDDDSGISGGDGDGSSVGKRGINHR